MHASRVPFFEVKVVPPGWVFILAVCRESWSRETEANCNVPVKLAYIQLQKSRRY